MKKDKKYIYAAKYAGGSYDDYYVAVAFVTHDKHIAEKWAEKYNRILKSYKDFYFQKDDEGEFVLKERYQDMYNSISENFNIDRYWDMYDAKEAFVSEIEVR